MQKQESYIAGSVNSEVSLRLKVNVKGRDVAIFCFTISFCVSGNNLLWLLELPAYQLGFNMQMSY